MSYNDNLIVIGIAISDISVTFSLRFWNADLVDNISDLQRI